MLAIKFPDDDKVILSPLIFFAIGVGFSEYGRAGLAVFYKPLIAVAHIII